MNRRGRWLEVTRQRWKLVAVFGTAFLGVLGAIVSGNATSPAVIRLGAWLSMSSIPVVALAVFSVRCKVCDELVLLWAWRHWPIGQWFQKLVDAEACPNCGARDQNDRAALTEPRKRGR